MLLVYDFFQSVYITEIVFCVLYICNVFQILTLMYYSVLVFFVLKQFVVLVC
jgi:hypothetical protein